MYSYWICVNCCYYLHKSVQQWKFSSPFSVRYQILPNRLYYHSYDWERRVFSYLESLLHKDNHLMMMKIWVRIKNSNKPTHFYLNSFNYFITLLILDIHVNSSSKRPGEQIWRCESDLFYIQEKDLASGISFFCSSFDLGLSYSDEYPWTIFSIY